MNCKEGPGTPPRPGAGRFFRGGFRGVRRRLNKLKAADPTIFGTELRRYARSARDRLCEVENSYP
jgi:hypothetical protein